MRELLASGDRGALRLLGGLLFGVGAILVIFRRTSFEDPWGDGALFFAFLVPTLVLYVPSVVGGRAAGRALPWQTACAVFGILLAPWTLFQLLEWLGATPDAPLKVSWVFLVTAAAGFAAALLAGVRSAACSARWR